MEPFCGNDGMKGLLPGVVDANLISNGVKEDGVLAGVEMAKKVFARFDPTMKVEVLLQDRQGIGSW